MVKAMKKDDCVVITEEVRNENALLKTFVDLDDKMCVWFCDDDK